MIRRYVKEYERVPFGYGEAWYDFPRRVLVCYPIPLNWIAWAACIAYWRLARVPRTRIEKVYQEAYIEGREAGRREWLASLASP